jgi:hypothetical protein
MRSSAHEFLKRLSAIELVMALLFYDFIVKADDQPGRNPLRDKIAPLSSPN